MSSRQLCCYSDACTQQSELWKHFVLVITVRMKVSKFSFSHLHLNVAFCLGSDWMSRDVAKSVCFLVQGFKDKQPDVTQTVASFTHLETLKCVCLREHLELGQLADKSDGFILGLDVDLILLPNLETQIRFIMLASVFNANMMEKSKV